MKRDKPFLPTSKMQAYLGVVVKTLVSREKKTHGQMCDEAGITYASLCDWRHNPRFVTWATAEIEAAQCSAFDYQRALAKAYQMAMDGSLEHLKFIAEERARAFGIMGNLPGAPVNQGPQLIFNIPRPPAELAGRFVIAGMFDAK